MRHVLSTGKAVEVYFNHEYEEVPIKKHMKAHTKWGLDENGQPYPYLDKDCPTEIKPFKTICKVIIDGNELTSEAICHINDMFSKNGGRRATWNKLVKGEGIKLHQFLNKQERRELFSELFPQYTNTAKTKNKFLTYCKKNTCSNLPTINTGAGTEVPTWVKDLLNGMQNLGVYLREKIKK